MTNPKTTRPYTAKQAIRELTALLTRGDIEAGHSDADRILCRLLETLGYLDVVEAYEKVEKWYA